MYTQRRFSIFPALFRTLPALILTAIWSASITAAYIKLDWRWLALPALPVSVLGTAVSFYLGFKGNAAYGRLWEARKIWGGIVNTSRTWGAHVTGFVSDSAEHQALVYRHVAWLAALRTRLRRPKPWENRSKASNELRNRLGTQDTSDEKLQSLIKPFLSPEDLAHTMHAQNQATRLLHTQTAELKRLHQEGLIDDFRHIELSRLVEELYTLQGKCERIKNFPLPRQYATANHWFVKIFLGMMPMALLGAFSTASLPPWLIIPASMVLGWVFYTWDLVVDFSENPFEGLVSDIPMNSMSRTIEIDLRDMLGETDLPPSIPPKNNIAL